MKSIMEKEPAEQCYLCGAWGQLERHHVFGGTANRRWSEKYGLTVHLCRACHKDGKDAAHNNAAVMLRLHQDGQRAFEYRYGHEKFMAVFGKNYLEGDEDGAKI